MVKVFKCLSCGADIRLERKPDNSGWLRWNLDGSEHVDEKKLQQNKGSSQTYLKVEELTSEISELRSQIKDLTAAVQFMRMELSKFIKETAAKK